MTGVVTYRLWVREEDESRLLDLIRQAEFVNYSQVSADEEGN